MTQTQWEQLTCKHGVTEGLDYHTCSECKKIAIQEGETWIDGQQTYLYMEKDEE